MQIKDLVLDILKEKDTKNRQKYINAIKGIIYKKVCRFFPKADYRELEEIANDITQDFFLWLIKENTKKKFVENKERLTNGYLHKKIANLIIDYLRKVDTLEKHIPISLDKTINEEEKTTFADIIPSDENKLELLDYKAVAVSFLRLLEQKLKEEQIKTLCHWIFRDIYSVDCFLKDLSSAAKYKRVERLKKSLKELLLQNPLEQEEWKAFIDLMQDYCQKRFGKCV